MGRHGIAPVLVVLALAASPLAAQDAKPKIPQKTRIQSANALSWRRAT